MHRIPPSKKQRACFATNPPHEQYICFETGTKSTHKAAKTWGKDAL